MRVYEYPDCAMLESSEPGTSPRKFERFTIREYAWLRFYRFLVMRRRFWKDDLIGWPRGGTPNA